MSSKEQILGWLSYIPTLLVGVLSNIGVKIMGACCFVFYNFLFGIDHDAMLGALMYLIFVDTFTGVLGAKLSKEEILPSKFFKVVLKTLTYYMLIAAAFNTEKILSHQFFLDETVLAFMAVTEMISILENTGKMGFIIPKKLLNKFYELRDE